ncbi:MAG: DUF669 domain-containing protein [Methylocystaceae bacterium]|nr:DUF669 domain-containing protein [Methylocystaceae bacterium]NBT96972.1 DUF669 domain-containing protein [Methylocystaceae bacterium]
MRLDSPIDFSKVSGKGGGFSLLPPGDYLVALKEARELTTTKNGQGTTLPLCFEVIDGDFTGRLIWIRPIFSHQKEAAQRFGQSLLKELCTAAGILVLEDTNQLLGVPVVGSVIIEKDKNGVYEDQNRIRSFSSAQGQAAPVAVAAVAPAARAASAPSWIKR